MQLVEQHVISKTDPRFAVIDAAAFASKNLYNLANYHVRQSFIGERKYVGYASVYHLVKQTDAYQALPAKVSNDVLRLLDKNWKAFFKAMQDWREDPSTFLGRPKLPGYKDKQKGRNVLIYDIQALSKKGLKNGLIQPSKLGIEVPTKREMVKQVRIVPKCSHYVVEVVYEQEPEQARVDPSLVAGLDLGLNNLATLVSNKPGFTPLLINGRPLKSINQGYNKHRAQLQSKLKRRFTSHQLERVTDKRNRRIAHRMHTASRRLIDLLVKEQIGTLIIGYNPEWKQQINLGRRTNQNFGAPHQRRT